MFKHPKRWHGTLGLYLYFAGILLGMFFAAMVTWSDFEASLFDASTDSSALPLESLKCPVLLNGEETGTVTATFKNTADWALRRTIDTHISHGFVILMREERTRIDLQPGEKRTLQWTISPEDAAWGRFILVRLHVQRAAPLPPRSGSCGVLVLNLPFGSGTQITIATVVISLALIVLGAMLWLRGTEAQHKDLRPVDYLALGLGPLTLFALLTSMLGNWLISAILLVLSTLIIVTIVTWILS
ncbi:MAG: hypothetical protein WHX52_03005 [Anaerolineae bacterium]